MIGIGAFGGARATLRLARRDAGRNLGRSLLIAVMVALPVLALSAVSVIFRSGQFEPRDEVAVTLGDRVQAAITVGDAGTPLIQDLLGRAYVPQTNDRPAKAPSGSEVTGLVQGVVPDRDVLHTDRANNLGRAIRAGDRALDASLREIDYTASGIGGLVQQLSGRAPAAPGEVVISRTMARNDQLGIGDRLRYQSDGAPNPDLTVVGIVGGLPLTGQTEVIGGPGDLFSPADAAGASTTWLVTGPKVVDWQQVQAANRHGLLVASRSVIEHPPADVVMQMNDLRDVYSLRTGAFAYLGVITVAIGLLLLQLALLAGPAIAVGARRNERTLALVSANGGLPRQVRGVVLAASGIIGLVGCLLAAVIGTVIGAVAVPLLREHRDDVLPRTDIHLRDLIILVLVGTLTAIGAALVPAILAARTNVIATLTGRRGQPQPARHTPILGLLITATGCVICLLGATHQRPTTTVLGIAIAEIGLVTLTGTIITLVAKAGRRLPFAGRFAIRDAARQRGRTAPAVAAVMAAIAGTVATGIFLASRDTGARLAYTPALATGSVSYQPPIADSVNESTSAMQVSAAWSALERTLPIDRIATVQGIVIGPGGPSIGFEPDPDQTCRGFTYSPNNYCQPEGPGLLASLGDRAIFDDGTALELITGQPQPEARAALKAGRAVVFAPELLWSPEGTVRPTVTTTNEDQSAFDWSPVVPAQLITARPGIAGVVFPPSDAKLLRVHLDVTSLVATTTRMPTADEEARAAAALSDPGGSFYVERGYPRGVSSTLIALVIASVVITLAGTFAAVGLAAAEGRADVSTLSAVGASPGVRRRVAAAQAGVITLIGSALGLATGLLAGWALIRLMGPASVGSLVQLSTSGRGYPFVVPWAAVLITVIGVPVLAIMLAFVFTRSRLPLVRRVG